MKQQIDKLDDLKPPKDMQDEVDKLIRDARGALDNLKKAVDEDVSKVLNNENDPFKDVNKQANEIGLTVCGQS